MSKLVLVVSRTGSQDPFGRVHLDHLSRRLSLQNIDQGPPRFIERHGVLVGIFADRGVVTERGAAFASGI